MKNLLQLLTKYIAVFILAMCFVLPTSGQIDAQSKVEQKSEITLSPEQQKALDQHRALEEKYNVKRGNRPPIDLSKVSEDTYEKGVLRVKLMPYADKNLDKRLITAEKNGFVETGVKSFDEINKIIGAKSYKRTLDDLYEVPNPGDVGKFVERHKAWGFHLIRDIEFDSKIDVKEAVKMFSDLGEVEYAEPVYKIRKIGPVTNDDNNKIEKKNELIKKGDDFVKPNENVDINNESSSKLTPNDPDYGNQYAFPLINAPAAWDITVGNPDVIVVVVDGGIQYDHPDLAANMWSGIGPDGTGTVPDAHGTHTSGTVAAVSNNGEGVAGCAGGDGTPDSGVKLISCDIFDGSVTDYTAQTYGADNGAMVSQNSWGYNSAGVYNQSALDGIDYFNANGGGAALDGGLVVFAAGNDNDNADWYPGYYGYDDPGTLGCMAVASTDAGDNRSSFSNYGDWIDIAAPGSNIYSTGDYEVQGFNTVYVPDSYVYMDGTSMACPHVSGIASAIVSITEGFLTNEELWQLLINNTVNIDAQNPGYEGMLGTGRIDFKSAADEGGEIASGLERPANFAATPTGLTDIQLTWTKNTQGYDVLLAYALEGQPFGEPVDGDTYNPGDPLPGGGEVLYVGPNELFDHNGLLSATTYSYKVFSIAGTNQTGYNLGDYSRANTASATTECGILALPLIEDFSAGQMPPTCWTTVDADGDGYNWFAADAGFAPYVGSFAAGSESWSGGTVLTPDNWLISPQLAVTEDPVTITFQVKAQDVDWPNEKYSVLVSTTDNNPASFTAVHTETLTNAHADWSIREIEINGYAGQDIYVAFRHWDCTDMFVLVIDDIKIIEGMYIPAVTNFTATTIADDQIQLDWTKNADNNDVMIVSSLDGTFGEPVNGTVYNAGQTIPGGGEVIYRGPLTTFDHINLQLGEIYRYQAYSYDASDNYSLPAQTHGLTGGWFHWDDGTFGGAIGTGGAATFEIASAWQPADLAPYDGMVLRKMRFRPEVSNATYTIKVWEGAEAATEVHSQVVTNPEIGFWTVVELDAEYIIDATKEIWFGVHINTLEGYPAGTDSGPSLASVGDLIRFEGDAAWSSLSTDFTIEGNWNIHMYPLAGTFHTITSSATAGGAISPVGNVSVLEGDNQAFTITPDVGYFISDVEVDGVSVGAVTDYTFNNVTAAHTIHAIFEVYTYTLTVNEDPAAGGSVTIDPVMADYPHGTTVDLTPVPAAGYVFSHFSGDIDTYYTIQASAGANGTIDPEGTVLVAEGGNQAFNFFPNAGYKVSEVLVGGVAVDPVPTTSHTINNVMANTTIEVTFEEATTYTITASAGANGTIDPVGDIVVIEGSDQSFTIAADGGYLIDDVLVDGASVGAVTSYTFTNVLANHTIEASFVENLDPCVEAIPFTELFDADPFIVDAPPCWTDNTWTWLNPDVQLKNSSSRLVSPPLNLTGDVTITLHETRATGGPGGGSAIYSVEYSDDDGATWNVLQDFPDVGATANIQQTINFTGVTPGIHLIAINGSSTHNARTLDIHDFSVTAAKSPDKSTKSLTVPVVMDQNRNITAHFIQDVTLGDVNDDTFINVLDVVWMVRHITGDTPVGFNLAAADVTQTGGAVTTADLTALIDLIYAGAKDFDDDLNSEQSYMNLNNDGLVSFDSDGTYSSLQFEFVSGVNEDMNPELLLNTDHKLSFNNETGIAVIYSMNNSLIPEGKIDLFSIGGVDIENVEWGFSLAANLNYEAIEIITGKEGEDATSIDDIADSGLDISVFPNPNTGNFSVKVDLDNAAYIEMMLIDERGRIITKSQRSYFSGGEHIIQYNSEQTLSNGIYVIKVNTYDGSGQKLNVVHEEKIMIIK